MKVLQIETLVEVGQTLKIGDFCAESCDLAIAKETGMQAVKIGGKIRRLRQERRINQVQMATELGISASYLNLIESNQRPVTVRVLLKLAERYHSISPTFQPKTTTGSKPS